MLRTLERNKTELIDRFVDRTEAKDPTLISSVDLSSVQAAFSLIDGETKELGVFDLDRMKQCFSDEETILELEELSQKWNHTSCFLKDSVEKEKNTDVLKALLDLSDLINRCASITSTRYAEQVTQRPKLSSEEKEKPRATMLESA